MSVLLQISDPHFGTEVPEVVEALARLAAQLAPDLLVVSGDITQRARRAQFAAARAFVDRLAVPAVLAIPGNHDIPLYNVFARAFAPYAGFRRAFGETLEPVHDAGDLLVVGLKTTRRRRHSDGELSREQVERSAARFAAARPDQLRIAVVHQPLAIVDPDDRENLMHGYALAARRWSEAGCDLVIGGHIHLPYLLPMTSRLDELPRELWVVQAGTAVSSRVRGDAPNSVNVIRTGVAVPEDAATGRHCAVERWDFRGQERAFVLDERRRIACGVTGER